MLINFKKKKYGDITKDISCDFLMIIHDAMFTDASFAELSAE